MPSTGWPEGPSIGGVWLPCGIIDAMDASVIVWRCSIVDERTGMHRRDALERYPGAEREPNSREDRRSSGSAAAIVMRGA